MQPLTASAAEDQAASEPEAVAAQFPLESGRTLSMHQLATELLEEPQGPTAIEQQAAAEAGRQSETVGQPETLPAEGPGRTRSGQSGLRMGDPGFERATSREPDHYLRMLGTKRAAASGWSTEGGQLEQLVNPILSSLPF